MTQAILLIVMCKLTFIMFKLSEYAVYVYRLAKVAKQKLRAKRIN